MPLQSNPRIDGLPSKTSETKDTCHLCQTYMSRQWVQHSSVDLVVGPCVQHYLNVLFQQQVLLVKSPQLDTVGCIFP